jgi:hypothetical protein
MGSFYVKISFAFKSRMVNPRMMDIAYDMDEYEIFLKPYKKDPPSISDAGPPSLQTDNCELITFHIWLLLTANG